MFKVISNQMSILARASVVLLSVVLIQSVCAQEQSEYSQETQELLDDLALKIQAATAAIHSNETRDGKGEVLRYSVHIPPESSVDLGLELDVSQPQNGFKVISVEEAGLAEKLGIQGGDVIVTVNHFEVNDANLEAILDELQSLVTGDSLNLTLKQKTGMNRVSMIIEAGSLPSVDLHIESHETELSGHVSDLSATSIPTIHSGYEEDLRFYQFQTYNFGHPTEIRDPDLSEMLVLQFSATFERQMSKRGFTKADAPDVLINISVDLKNATMAPKQLVQIGSASGACPSYRFYNGGPRPVSSAGSRSVLCEYKEGSINIDMIVVKQRRALWSGVSLVRIENQEAERNLINPGTLLGPVYSDTDIMFENFPFRIHQEIGGTNEEG